MNSSHSSPHQAQQQLLSVVVPIYNEEKIIDELHARLTPVLEGIGGLGFEVVLVDDGSSDASWPLMQQLSGRDPRYRSVKLSRNFGHQVAITAGLDHARGDAVVVIDADLQDPPEVIPEMVAKWREGFDVVYGVRESRDGESFLKLWTAGLFYRLLRRFTNVDIPVDVGDFRLLSHRAAAQLRELKEKDRFVRGLVSWMGFNQTGVTYHREARFAGETKYPYSKMIKFALDGITSFSSVPLKLASWLGYATSVLAFLYMLSVFVQKALGYTVPGFATIMVAMLFVGGVQLICLGIIGEYIGRIFNEIKPRPIYIIDTVVGGEQAVSERAAVPAAAVEAGT